MDDKKQNRVLRTLSKGEGGGKAATVEGGSHEWLADSAVSEEGRKRFGTVVAVAVDGAPLGDEAKETLAEQRDCEERDSMASKLGLRVGVSLVQGAGEGLFAVERFPKGHILCVYSGVVLSLAKVLKMSVKERDYVMGGFGLNAHVDARHDLSVLAR